MKQISLALGVLWASLLLTSCAQNPVTGRSNFVMMSESDEVRVGTQADTEVRKEYGVYDAPALQAYVNQIGQRLAAQSHRANLAYQFTVVDSPDINAFALPGGYVYITRGILAYLNSEAELAAVLGHEIGHVTARHSVQQYSATQATNIGMTIGSIFLPQLRSAIGQNIANVLGSAALSGYGREHELEADRLGAEYLARTGYNPNAMVNVVGVLKNQELFDIEMAKKEGREPRAYHGLFASHPSADARLHEVVGEASRFASSTAVENRTEFLRQLSGLIYGDSSQQGVVKGSGFYHSELGFALQFPRNWRIRNTPNRVLAKSQSGDALLELNLAGPAQGSPMDMLRRLLRLSGGAEVQSTSINGLSGAIASTTRAGRPIRAALIYLENKAYVIAGAATSTSVMIRSQDEITAAMMSFHRLSPDERELAQPLKITFMVADANTRFSDLARNSPLRENAEGYLRLLNAVYPGGEPEPGQIVKVVQ